MKISICIPTYNRAEHLKNCLNSIFSCRNFSNHIFEICISDNNSTDHTEEVVRNAQRVLDVNYRKNLKNLGIPRNFIQVVSMATGDFIWLIGDDDLLLPHSIDAVSKLIEDHPDVDFFYVNSFHLTTEYLKGFPSPFNTKNLPLDMPPFSKWDKEGETPFFKLIDPRISFDFLGGMFLSVFRKSNWEKNIDILDSIAINDDRVFSHFDNTFPHIKIFSKAFSNSKAYFNKTPLNVCLTGAREWSPMYPLIHSVRLIEALNEYRKNGMSYWRYIYCKNYALNNFAADFTNILIHKKISGYHYISPIMLLFSYMLYPNFYLSPFYFIGRRIRYLFGHIFKF